MASSVIFNKSTKSYLGFETYFLQDNIIVKFDEVVKVIRCQGEDIRLAVSGIQPRDLAQLSSKAVVMLAAFPGGGKTFKDMLCDQVLFIKADKAQLFNHLGQVDDIANLPKVSMCHLAIEIIGMKKSKEDVVSYMMRTHQLKTVDAIEVTQDCLFN
jgi:hypothetical protein